MEIIDMFAEKLFALDTIVVVVILLALIALGIFLWQRSAAASVIVFVLMAIIAFVRFALPMLEDFDRQEDNHRDKEGSKFDDILGYNPDSNVIEYKNMKIII